MREHVENYKGYEVYLVTDEMPTNPRDFYNLGTIAFAHRRYNLGDEQIFEPVEWLEEKLGLKHKGEYNKRRLAELEARFFDEYVAMPLYLLDHSGLALSTSPFSCPWDSGQVGYIYVSKKDARDNWGLERLTRKYRDWVLTILENEVKIYCAYISDEVFGFEIEDTNGNVVDSLYGFYGHEEQKYALQEARGWIDAGHSL